MLGTAVEKMRCAWCGRPFFRRTKKRTHRIGNTVEKSMIVRKMNTTTCSRKCSTKNNWKRKH